MAKTIGEQLKEAREKRGLTLEQASVATHIRTSYLEALESDRRSDLPSTVQGRGFMRLYADLLGLPVRPLLDAWEGRLPAEPDGQDAQAAGEGTGAEPATTQAAPGSPAEPDASSPLSTVKAGPARPLPAVEAPPAPDPQTVNLPLEPEPEEDAEGQPASSKAIFREVGLVLRKQRETLGLSLVEVERYTRLRTHYITAMETGRVEDLPSPVQGRGMISNYASFLNLDEDKILLRFAEGLQARRIERIPKPEPQGIFNPKKRPARQAPFWRRFLTPDLIFGVGVAAIILLFALWTATRINSLRSQISQPTPPAIAEILLTPEGTLAGTAGAATPGSTRIAGQSTGVPQTPLAPAAGEATQPGSVVESTPVASAPKGTPAAVVTGAPAGTATLLPINQDPLQVYIIARQRAWLRVVADDKLRFLGRTVPGNAYAFSGLKRLELSTGNGAALQVFYNQMDLGTLGNTGEVVSLIFSAEGITTPTPAFTPTGTPTSVPTATPLPSATPRATPTITPYVPTK